MATYGKKLLDNSGNVILPKTRSSLVYMDDNTEEISVNEVSVDSVPMFKRRLSVDIGQTLYDE